MSSTSLVMVSPSSTLPSDSSAAIAASESTMSTTLSESPLHGLTPSSLPCLLPHPTPPAPFVCTQPTVPLQIKELYYNVLSAAETRRLSALRCRRVMRSQLALGVSDRRLGVSERGTLCETCKLPQADCVGHPGHIDLEVPVFHLGYFTATLRICRTICKNCSHVLLTDVEKAYYRHRMASMKAASALQRVNLVKAIQQDAYKTRLCPHCSHVNGVVRRVRPMRIVHDQIAASKPRGIGGSGGLGRGASDACDPQAELQCALAYAARSNEEIRHGIQFIQDVLDPIRVRALFEAIPPEDVCLLGFNPGTNPASLITSAIPVTPVPTRPSGVAQVGSGIREDEITIQYHDILSSIDITKVASVLDAPKFLEQWDMLQMKAARILDGTLPGFPVALRGDCKSFAQRMKGKHGRFRGNLSGKRVDFSGRSVISPDPNVRIDEMVIPLRIARVLTYPQRVYVHNLEQLRQMVRNGPECHPGAITVTFVRENACKALLTQRDREAHAERLAVGDIVERHMITGDLVLFNRQPSLHRISMMCHLARVLPSRTFRFNECCCSPYNADFDGDEMNIHLVQTEEARAEARTLMLTAQNIITAKNGEPIIACTQDFLTAAHLITSRDCFFDRTSVGQCVAHWLRPGEHFVLPIPAILKPRELWTGKQLFDILINPDRGQFKDPLDIASATKSYSGKNRELCKNEGFVRILNGELIAGRFDKKLLGGGAKDGLFARLCAIAGNTYSAEVMGRFARFTSRYLMDYGFSLGLGDVAPTAQLQVSKERVLSESFACCRALIAKADAGTLEPLPGLTVAKTLEARLNEELSKVRETCGNAAVNDLKPSNAPLVMAQSGSKGSALNIAQMIACVGQQTVSGRRIQNAFIDRTLPHYPRFAEDPDARGFVSSSFYSSLKPTEFYFHTMAGREGLVDTAVKTAETGYIYRRLMKAMEDLSIKYDGTVRNSKNDVVQLVFGEDGLDPQLMEGSSGSPVDLAATWLTCLSREKGDSDVQEGAATGQGKKGGKTNLALGAPFSGFTSNSNNNNNETGFTSVSASLSGERTRRHRIALAPSKVLALVDAALKTWSSFTKCSEKFKDEIRDFWVKKVDQQRQLRRRLGLDEERIGVFATAPEDVQREGQRNTGGGDVAQESPSSEGFASLAICESGHMSGGAQKEENYFESHSALTPTLNNHSIFDYEHWATETLPLTSAIVNSFLRDCARKYQRKVCEPGTPCGAIAAQSVGEPSTQMTLRTFHFAGVASMSITQGVPRLVEIINANKTIATPIVRVPLADGAQSMREAVFVKAQMERVQLKEVASTMTEVVDRGSVYIHIVLNMRLIEDLHLKIDSSVVRDRILEVARRPMSKLRKLATESIQVVSADTLNVTPPGADGTYATFSCRQLLAYLPEITVGGITGVKRAIISKKKDGGEKGKKASAESFDIIADSAELLSIMNLQGVDGEHALCNHVSVIEKTLGVEAARASIVAEIQSVLKAYSLNIDMRHIYLLADVMSSRGEVLGIQRYGIQKMNNGVLTMASFERTTEHLYNAALYQKSDTQLSVSDSVIVGAPVPLGSNSFSLRYDYQQYENSRGGAGGGGWCGEGAWWNGRVRS